MIEIGSIPVLSPAEIKILRAESGVTQKKMAEAFGYKSVRAWQQKEEAGAGNRGLSAMELHMFLLLLNQHPSYKLVKISGASAEIEVTDQMVGKASDAYAENRHPARWDGGPWGEAGRLNHERAIKAALEVAFKDWYCHHQG